MDGKRRLKCENSSGTARPTGITGIMCDYGASIMMGGKVTITDQISLGYYSTSTGDKHGKIIVVDELDTGDNPLPLRINPDKTKYPDGTVLAEKGTGYTGSLNLSDFAWKYDYNGYENTSRMLTMSDDGTQVLAGTLKSPVRKGSPNLETTRGMIITMLWRMEGQPNVTDSVFTDVPADSYYAKAIAWGSANGIVEGYDDGLYRPDQNISRQELAAILYRYAAYSGRNVSQRRDLSGFADAASVSQWASEYMSWAVAEGLIQGTDMNRLEPLSFATRAVAAAMLERFLNN